MPSSLNAINMHLLVQVIVLPPKIRLCGSPALESSDTAVSSKVIVIAHQLAINPPVLVVSRGKVGGKPTSRKGKVLRLMKDYINTLGHTQDNVVCSH